MSLCYFLPDPQKLKVGEGREAPWLLGIALPHPPRPAKSRFPAVFQVLPATNKQTANIKKGEVEFLATSRGVLHDCGSCILNPP